MSDNKKRALALFSGGLDSIIAVKYMEKIGVEVIPIFFSTPFFPPEKAVRMAEINNIDLKVIDITEKHLEMMKHPRYGFGKFLNPCIDCHGLMFNILYDYLETYDADFMISGEVLNQRPMSQTKNALIAVGKLSQTADLIIRPLSQKLIKDTLPIREGWINKEDLLDIQGRTRIRQMQLADDLGVIEYPNSGGGCLLTDKGYTKRLQDLITHDSVNIDYLQFLAYGRHFRINPDTKLIVTRIKQESDIITPLIKDEIIIKCKDIPGPLGIIQSKTELSEEIIRLCASIVIRYNAKSQEQQTMVYGKVFVLDNEVISEKITEEDLIPFKIN